MTPDLSTTNTFLGIMAAVSLIEGLAIVALLAGGYLMYRRVMQTLREIEARHIGPTAVRVNAILDDVRGVTSVVKGAAETTDAGVRGGLAWLLRRVQSTGRAA
ncbi:MAG: hypothetical protein A3F70_11115 [Acidobacteria bacterium RIFCSPLOWO2_12_FULL_67_14]|nr:MAG: hypothetical protein A3H29_16935 [Acidobacteria bacterium RIFCSPLOWO2_02_FULL_67_21]OFW39091.1 MAG: hypothetical protein A3F70_11115 [Acidobacteria bacterium RIFCSPLOWO2_12_FULL_67_14]